MALQVIFEVNTEGVKIAVPAIEIYAVLEEGIWCHTRGRAELV